MAYTPSSDEQETLVRSFSGFGVDEKSVISILGKWHPEQRQLFRKTSSRFFGPDGHHHSFERWSDHHIKQLELEFSRFMRAVVLRARHPWERDARWAHLVISKEHPESILIEIACTRSSEDLLGVRRAYHSLFHHSLEEDVAYHLKRDNTKLSVALVSAFRYEGSHVDDAVAKTEAKVLGNAIRNGGDKKPIENMEVIRILTTRSKLHLKTTFEHYKEIHGNGIFEDLASDSSLQQTAQCLDSPPVYFCNVLDEALRQEADEYAKGCLTRIIVTRSDVDLKEIKKQYHDRNGVSLEEKIENTTQGNFKDFLLKLAGRAE